MFTKKKTVLPLANAERIGNALAAFQKVKEELIEIQYEIEGKITEVQTELKTLNADHQSASDAIKRIQVITG